MSNATDNVFTDSRGTRYTITLEADRYGMDRGPVVAFRFEEDGRKAGFNYYLEDFVAHRAALYLDLGADILLPAKEKARAIDYALTLTRS